ncbi:GumC family protein [Pontibacter beigongshangensis]|uniref:GumC family protein n=1 Tax=Pontibacter beigongshangensis TaxID=2574733 RepID=UPI00164F78DF|nr:Wzz/FepE/Etk N-terminal domain-containing protein [Pontibacter beigongshangensis]
MKLTDIFKLLRQNWFLLVAVTSVTAASIFFFTKNTDEEYTSDTTIYTGIATGYNLSSVTESSNQYKAANNAFANLISIIDSRDIRKELGFRLLAMHLMLKEHNPEIIQEENYVKLQKAIPAALKAKVVGATVEETADNLASYYHATAKNEIRDIINSEDFTYSESSFATIKAKRDGDSDLIMISYTSTDPVQTKITLDALTYLFVEKHKQLFTAQSESVVSYFTTGAEQALQKLKLAEENLLNFQQANNIIDYNAQVGSTASEKSALLAKYNDLEIEYAGALATLNSLEQSLKERGVPNLYSQEVLQLKNKLSRITTEIVELELLNKGKSNPAYNNRLAALKQDANDLSSKMMGSVDKHYTNTHTIQGLPTATMLTDWVRNTFLVEELKSKMSLLNKQKAVFAQQYEKLMPLGAESRKYTRDVNMAEQEYLAQLDGLKQSMLNQQNIELVSQLKVVDPPYIPSSPIASRVLLILFGSIGVFLLTLGGLLAYELLDQSVRRPSVAVKKMKYPVFGVLPETDASSAKQLQLAQNAEDQLARQLILKMKQKNSVSGPFIVGVLSSRSGEGKTALCNTLATSLTSLGIETQVLYPENHKGLVSADDLGNFYAPLQGVLTNASIADLAGVGFANNAVVIVEFPAVLEDTYPVSLLRHLDLVLLTVKANRVWQQADKAMFESIQKVTNAPIETVLSAVQQDDAKEMVTIRPKHVLQEQKALQAPKSLATA